MAKNYFVPLFFVACFSLNTTLRAQDGTLDVSFGSGGIVTTSFLTGSIDAANDIALQSDGKIVAAGSTVDPGSDMENISLARYLTNGSLDNSFGAGGKVTTEVIPGFISTGSSVEIQPDGKILVGGYANDTNGAAPQNGYFVVVRYKTNGTLDSTFGLNGIAAYQVPAVFDPEVNASSMLLQPDGRIVIAGGAFINFVDGDMVFMRLDITGNPDPTFGNAGMSVQAPQFGGAFPTAIARMSDGRIAVACFIDAGTHNDPLLTALDTSGVIDANFGTAGFVTPTYGSSSGFLGITVQPDNKIVACGFGIAGAVIARFYDDGTTDASFGTAGAVIIPIGSSQDAEFEDVKVQADGKIIASGIAEAQFAMVRTNDLGVLDAAFGTGGIVRTAVGPGIADMAAAIALQPDGKIVLGGCSFTTSPTAPEKYALARYNNSVTGIFETDVETNAITIFPNPTPGNFSIVLPAGAVKAEASVFNSLGELVVTIDCTTAVTAVNSHGLTNGTYEIVITCNGTMQTQKLVITDAPAR